MQSFPLFNEAAWQISCAANSISASSNTAETLRPVPSLIKEFGLLDCNSFSTFVKVSLEPNTAYTPFSISSFFIIVRLSLSNMFIIEIDSRRISSCSSFNSSIALFRASINLIELNELPNELLAFTIAGFFDNKI